ncbi:MAG: gamma-glutamyl-phosphate reductase [Nodosilinea sp. LVE1205-7]|jgi:glutamate-5-semialdehyde dehydrogenase
MPILTSQADFSQAMAEVTQASFALRMAGADLQGKVLEAMANNLQAAQDDILEANTLDLEACLDMAVPEIILDWLRLTPERLQTAGKILRRLAALGDPRLLKAQPISHLTRTVSSYSQVLPLGVIALVYEALPELAIIMAGLCVRTGNGLILKGGNEASQTHQVILRALHQSFDQVGLSSACLLSLTEEYGDAARSWLLQEPRINLIVPYGRPGLVQQVVRQAGVPVLPTTIGNGFLYWSASGDVATATHMIADSHRGEPDAVNAMEKVLIDVGCSRSAIVELCHSLWDKGFHLLGDENLVADIPALPLLKSDQWSHPFLSKTVVLGRVDSLETAADWINQFGGGHASSLVSNTYHEVCQFTQLVNSAVLYINASPRFVRNPPWRQLLPWA